MKIYTLDTPLNKEAQKIANKILKKDPNVGDLVYLGHYPWEENAPYFKNRYNGGETFFGYAADKDTLTSASWSGNWGGKHYFAIANHPKNENIKQKVEAKKSATTLSNSNKTFLDVASASEQLSALEQENQNLKSENAELKRKLASIASLAR